MKRLIATVLVVAMSLGLITAAIPPQQVHAAEEEIVIVLDPGHDSKHTGAFQNGYKEHELNFKIAEYCYKELSTYRGVKVYMTRDTNDCAAGSEANTETCLDYRAEFAAEVGADALISFHLNSETTKTATGAEIYYPTTNYDMNCHTVGKGLATEILDNLGDLGLKERGIYAKHSESRVYPDGSAGDYYRVIREAKKLHIPALIIEHAYMSNATEASNYLSSDDKLKALGVADATAIAEYFNLQKGFNFKWTNLGASTFNIGSNAKIYYAVNEPAKVTVEVYDGNNNFIKTLESGKSVQTNDQVATWDLKDAKGRYVANGTYRFTLTAVNANGEKKVSHKWFKVDGNVDLDFKWVVMDKGGASIGNNTRIYYAVNKEATITVEVFDGKDNYIKTLTSGKKVQTNDQVELWDLTDAKGIDVLDGTYRFTVTATSDIGEKVVMHRWFKVTGNPTLSVEEVKVVDSTYRIGELAKLQTKTNKNAKLTVELYYGNNSYMKTLVSNKEITGQEDITTWDLTDVAGNYVQDGTYRFTVIITTENGEKQVTHKWFKVSGSIPLQFNELGVTSSGVAGEETAKIEYSVNKYSNITVEVYDGNNNFIKTLETKVPVGLDTAITEWDLKGRDGIYVLDGTYRFTIIAESKDGEKKVSHKWFKTTGNPALAFGEVTVDAEVDGVTSIPLYVSLNKSGTITVELYDGKDNYVRTLVVDMEAGKDSVEVLWDLKNCAGEYMEAGNYRFTIISKSVNGERVVKHKYFKISHYTIMGTSNVTLEQMVAYYNANEVYPEFYANSDAPTIEDFCAIYLEECAIEGVKAEVAFCQAMLETGFLRFIGDVDISQYNFAGIGATGGGEPGNSFSSVREGIRAQVQHLKAYASTEELVQECVDPRFELVTRYSSPYVEWLGIQENPFGGGWAAAKGYGIIMKNNYMMKLFSYK